MLSAITLAVLLVWIEKIIYGNIQQGDELIKSIEAGVLSSVFKRGVRSTSCARYSCVQPLASLLRLISRPSAWKSSFRSSWYIFISPLYYFTFRVILFERSVILCLCSILFRHIKMIKLCILKDSYEQILKDYTKSFLLTNIRIRTTI